tara:strand:- start:276 stop:551 length:276 start_codon:yes stop_codon:yes gene_type:complete
LFLQEAALNGNRLKPIAIKLADTSPQLFKNLQPNDNNMSRPAILSATKFLYCIALIRSVVQIRLYLNHRGSLLKPDNLIHNMLSPVHKYGS